MELSKLPKPLMKVNTIVTSILPWDKTYSFRRTTIDKENKILNTECKSLPQIYFMKQDDDLVNSAMVLDEKSYFKDSLPLVKTGNEKSIYLFV